MLKPIAAVYCSEPASAFYSQPSGSVHGAVYRRIGRGDSRRSSDRFELRGLASPPLPPTTVPIRLPAFNPANTRYRPPRRAWSRPYRRP